MTKIACVTMMKDEDFFLPIWFRYYSRIFGAENLFIIDHSSARAIVEMLDPELRGSRVNTFCLPPRAETSDIKRERSFDKQRFTAISGFIGGLLAFYDLVLFNDADEIFVADPARYRDLADYLDRSSLRGQIAAGIGVELFHDRHSEAAFDSAAPIFSQRRNVFLSPLYSKPHILGRPSTLSPHAVADPFILDPDLYLFHLKFVDAGHLYNRQEVRRRAGESDPVLWESWKWEGSVAQGQLTKFEALPIAQKPLSGRAVCRSLFGRATPIEIGAADGPERLRNRSGSKQRVLDHISKQDEARLRKHRYILPDAFAESGI
ncbi:glycosyltransferase family 2 protein [Poseidonocella sp. HB161398]|uniref:glycosyltransferase family 2 protein n=1 Tax=Poseidonocella sp. HB161398 TaxID=2320855 RepID=UPI001108DA06|nr:glycosyltransferase family 2 protein [Poseidonocella sp. HB161398]